MGIKTSDGLTLQQAMDNLAAIASIDLSAPGPIGLLKHRIITSEEEVRGTSIVWLSGEGSEAILEALDATYATIRHYLTGLAHGPETDWDNPKMLHGLAAMMALVVDSTSKIEQYIAIRLNKPAPKIGERPEYQELQACYQQFFSDKVKTDELHEVNDAELKDMEVVRSDREYELFYIRHEDGRPYYRPELLRHMRLACTFDSDAENFEDDPLLQIRSMLDRDYQMSAGQVLRAVHGHVVDFYHHYRKLPTYHGLAKELSQALMALLLAANPQNLLQNSSGKSAMQYFEDFQKFLRGAYLTTDYQKLIAYPPGKDDKAALLLLGLTHALSRALFTHLGGIKQEMIALIFRTSRRGSEKGQLSGTKGETLWSQLLRDDENYRTWLAKFPSGPLLKILDLVRQDDEESGSLFFDPLTQGNLPRELFRCAVSASKSFDVLHMPSPTRQALINKPEVLDEFKGFLRGSDGVHLLINLQDRTIWREFPRAHALESLQKNAEFHDRLRVVSLPKNTDFYFQSNEYLNLTKATDFMSALEAQVADPEGCGFFFPSEVSGHEIVSFTKKLLPKIHTWFFGEKPTLNRRAREDFVEIFYHFLTLKLIDQLGPSSLSFTCKDGIDTGAASAGSFYAFLKLLSGGLADKESQDYLRWLLYAPALMVRERALDAERLTRALTALERLEVGLEEHRAAIHKEVDGWKSVKIS